MVGGPELRAASIDGAVNVLARARVTAESRGACSDDAWVGRMCRVVTGDEAETDWGGRTIADFSPRADLVLTRRAEAARLRS
jgi:hypothetical protein